MAWERKMKEKNEKKEWVTKASFSTHSVSIEKSWRDDFNYTLKNHQTMSYLIKNFVRG
jgi:hypothetical protein